MLKREHIKQAIDAISSLNPEIGYTLDEMLGMGRIYPLVPRSSAGADFYFQFDGHPATVKKVIFFNAGTAPIEERLLIKYGEMLERHRLSETTDGFDFHEAARRIRSAGLRFMVTREIDRAIAGLEKKDEKPAPVPGEAGPDNQDDPDNPEKTPAGSGDRQVLIERLESIKNDLRSLAIGSPALTDSSQDVYIGKVDAGREAFFLRFPFCMDALMQVADINLEFFHVRFLLTCLTRGLDRYLYACVVDNRIEGMIYLTFREAYLYRALEIHYIATVRGRPADEAKTELRELKGVGTFLVAGVWMLWKRKFSDCRDILLDSEVGARRFYQAVGFKARGFSEFVLGKPQRRLARAIVEMANLNDRRESGLIQEVGKILESQFELLCVHFWWRPPKRDRDAALATVKACLSTGAVPELVQTAVRLLIEYRDRIPEAAQLARYVGQHGSEEIRRMLAGYFSSGSGSAHGR